MRGSVVRLTIGDYIYRMPGFLETISITIDNSNTPWEIQLYGPLVESDVAQLPHMVTVACTFRPILDILPSRVTMANPRVSLIGNVEKDIFMGNIVDKTPTPQIPIPQEDEIVIVDEDVRIPAIQVGANSADTATKKKAVVNKANKQAAAKANAKAKQAPITRQVQSLVRPTLVTGTDNTFVRRPIIPPFRPRG
jgi:hypothetical protein